MKLRMGHVYELKGMTADMWQVGHPRYGKPKQLVGIFIGIMRGTRKWYGFEIHVGGQERGVIFMPEEDLATLKVRDLGPYHT
jgi:hypothetical protein